MKHSDKMSYSDVPAGSDAGLLTIPRNYVMDQNISETIPNNSEKRNPLGSIALATLISRITGFIRILFIGIFLISPAIRSAFTIANNLPNQIAALAFETVLTSVVTPILCQVENEDSDKGKAFFNKLFTLSTIVLNAAFVISCTIVPWFIPWQTSHQVPNALAEIFSYILLPQIVFYGLSSLFSAMLNVQGKFVLAAWAPVINNLIGITAILVCVMIPGDFYGSYAGFKIFTLCGGTTLGVIVQAAMMIPTLRSLDFMPRFSFGLDERLKKFSKQALAITLYVFISQIGLYLTQSLASQANANGPFAYSTAWQFLQVPYGVLGLSILTTTTPSFSRYATAGSYVKLRAHYRHISLLSSLLLWPGVAILTIFGPEISASFYGLKSTNSHDIGEILTWSAITIIPYAFVLLQLRIFYALNHPWTPIIIIVVITTTRIAFNYLGKELLPIEHLVSWLGLSNGLSFGCGALIGSSLLRSYLHGPSKKRGDIKRCVFFSLSSFLFTSALKALTYGLHIFPNNNRFITIITTFILCVISLCLITTFLSFFKFILISPLKTIISNGFTSFFPNNILTTEQLPSSSPNNGIDSNNLIDRSIIVPEKALEVFLSKRNISLENYLGGKHLGIEFWKATDHKLEREIGITVAPSRYRLSKKILSIEKIESHCIAKLFDELTDPVTKVNCCISQWVQGYFLSQVTLLPWRKEQIVLSMKNLALAINYSHAQNLAIGLGDPLNIRFTYSGKAILVYPVPNKLASLDKDIQGFAAIIYTLMTKKWPLNFFTNKSWDSELPLAYTNINDLAPISNYNCDIDPEFDRLVCIAITNPDDIDNTANFIDAIISTEHQPISERIWEPVITLPQKTTLPEKKKEKFSPPRAPLKNWPFISTSLIGLLVVLTTISMVAAFSFGSYEQENSIKGINDLISVPQTTSNIPYKKPTFKPLNIVDFSGNPNTLDKKYIAYLPHIINGRKPRWQTDNYYAPNPKTAKITSNGIGIVLEFSAPQPLSAVEIFSPSIGAQLSVYSFDTTATSLDKLQHLSDTVKIEKYITTIHINSYTGKYLLIWISQLAKFRTGYSVTIEKISLL